MVSRVVFPASFLIFNLIYWFIYQVGPICWIYLLPYFLNYFLVRMDTRWREMTSVKYWKERRNTSHEKNTVDFKSEIRFIQKKILLHTVSDIPILSFCCLSKLFYTEPWKAWSIQNNVNKVSTGGNRLQKLVDSGQVVIITANYYLLPNLYVVCNCRLISVITLLWFEFCVPENFARDMWNNDYD